MLAVDVHYEFELVTWTSCSATRQTNTIAFLELIRIPIPTSNDQLQNSRTSQVFFQAVPDSDAAQSYHGARSGAEPSNTHSTISFHIQHSALLTYSIDSKPCTLSTLFLLPLTPHPVSHPTPPPHNDTTINITPPPPLPPPPNHPTSYPQPNPSTRNRRRSSNNSSRTLPILPLGWRRRIQRSMLALTRPFSSNRRCILSFCRYY